MAHKSWKREHLERVLDVCRWAPAENRIVRLPSPFLQNCSLLLLYSWSATRFIERIPSSVPHTKGHHFGKVRLFRSSLKWTLKMNEYCMLLSTDYRLVVLVKVFFFPNVWCKSLNGRKIFEPLKSMNSSRVWTGFYKDDLLGSRRLFFSARPTEDMDDLIEKGGDPIKPCV